MYYLQRALFFIAIWVLILAFPGSAFAENKFSLTLPSGTLSRGQEYPFKVTINTQGSPVSSATVGLQYETQYLQYIGAVPGDAMGSLRVEDIGNGKLVMTGTANNFNGTGTFATLTFKIIASAPGSTQLCTFFQPEVTTAPTAAPTQVIPTKLPKSGGVVNTYGAGIAGFIFLVVATYFFRAFGNADTEAARKKQPRKL